MSQNLSIWWNTKNMPEIMYIQICIYNRRECIVNFLLRISSYKNIITAQITIFTCFLSHIYHIYNFYLILNLNAVCIETGNNPLTNDWDLLACKPQYQILWHQYLGSIQPISLVEFHYTSNLLANIQPTPVSSLHEKPKVHSKFHSQCL